MPPMTPTTLTRIDPAFPLLWRDVDTVQFGMDTAQFGADTAQFGAADAVRVPLSEPWVEPLLQAMRTGFRRTAFDVIAHGVGAPRDAARELLRLLEPVLRTDLPPRPPIWIESVNLNDSRVEARLGFALRDEAFTTVDRSVRESVGIVLVHGAASAHQLARYLRDDVAHIPVAFEPGNTTIGPLILPGRTPCLACRDAHERDRDPAWPSMHAQLVGATSVPITAARTAEAAGLVARLLGEAHGAKHAKSVRVSADGRRAWREATFHEECLCRELTYRSLQGTATPDAPLGLQSETTTAPEFSRRA